MIDEQEEDVTWLGKPIWMMIGITTTARAT